MKHHKDKTVLPVMKSHIRKKEERIWANPRDFLKSPRIDLIPKLWYIKNKEEKINADFFVRMYLEHIKAFNHFNEDRKRKKEDFINDFDKIITSIKKEGFKKEKGLIPSTDDSVAIDGAHRIASSIFFGKKIYVEKNKEAEGPNYNYKYFRKRGLPESILEEIIFRYFKVKKEGLYVCIFWGSALGKLDGKEIKEELRKERIEEVYSKKVDLTERGKRNLIITCYGNEPWMNDKKNDFSGAIRKVAPCFKNSNKIKFYLLETKNKQNILNFKKKIREKLNMGNHSLHTSNMYEETRNLCNILLNKNSLFFINHGEKMILPEILDKNELKERIDFAVTSSYVLEKFGIRKAEDIDYIINSNKQIRELGSNHNQHFSSEEIKELIYNPKNFFRFKGIKFLTLENILKFKKTRNENKDKRDIFLIERFLSKKKGFNYKERIVRIQVGIISLVLGLIKKIPQSRREQLKKNRPIMLIYKKLFT